MHNFRQRSAGVERDIDMGSCSVFAAPLQAASAAFAVVRCPSVRLYVTFVYCVETVDMFSNNFTIWYLFIPNLMACFLDLF